MKFPILYFFVMIKEISFHLILDIVYKSNKLPKGFLKKDIKLVLYEGGNIVLLNLGLVLLPAKIDFFIEKQKCKKYSLVALCTSCLKIVLALLAEVIAFHIQVLIIQVGLFSLKGPV